jgi:hypothetical protein
MIELTKTAQKFTHLSTVVVTIDAMHSKDQHRLGRRVVEIRWGYTRRYLSTPHFFVSAGSGRLDRPTCPLARAIQSQALRDDAGVPFANATLSSQICPEVVTSNRP